MKGKRVPPSPFYIFEDLPIISNAHAFAENPDAILQELVTVAVELCGADSAAISVRRRVEQFRLAPRTSIGTEQRLSLRPAATAGQDLPIAVMGVSGFCYKIGPVGDELRVEPQHCSQRALDLRPRIVARLKAAH